LNLSSRLIGKTWSGRQAASEEKVAKIRTMKRKGFTVRDICKKLEFSSNTIYAVMRLIFATPVPQRREANSE
jgi:orotate phosphoribosyltransferase-like protein